jgi:hypothetical protein
VGHEKPGSTSFHHVRYAPVPRSVEAPSSFTRTFAGVELALQPDCHPRSARSAHQALPGLINLPSGNARHPMERVIDVGSGAGFPGLPLKIACPKMRLTLVESVGKKAEFCRQVIETLQLEGVRVLQERAEVLGQSSEHRERYDWALGRAVAIMPVLAEYLLPLKGWGTDAGYERRERAGRSSLSRKEHAGAGRSPAPTHSGDATGRCGRPLPGCCRQDRGTPKKLPAPGRRPRQAAPALNSKLQLAASLPCRLFEANPAPVPWHIPATSQDCFL